MNEIGGYIPQGMYNPPARELKSIYDTMARINALMRYADIVICILIEGELMQIELIQIVDNETLRYICKPRQGIGIAVDRHWSVPLFIYIGRAI